MTESIFREYVSKYLGGFVGKTYERINGRPEGAQPKLLYKELLTSEFSPKFEWGSTGINRSVVSADVVSLNSPLPLKSRGSISKATGAIPKLGMKFRKYESDIQDIQLAISVGASEGQIVAKLMSDVSLGIKGVEVAKEIMFLQALSTGVTLVRDEDSDNRGTRADFGYLPEHNYTVGTKWSEAGAKPISDLQQVIDEAEADTARPAVLFIGRKAFDRIRSSAEGKQLALRYKGAVVVTDPEKLPAPSRADLKDALADELSIEVIVVGGSFRVQNPDGSIKTVTPWEEANVILAPDKHVGRLVWSNPVEKSSPDKAAEYANGEEGTLAAIWHEREPFSEVTSVQARAIPVIDLGAQIYLVETETATTGAKKETKAKK